MILSVIPCILFYAFNYIILRRLCQIAKKGHGIKMVKNHLEAETCYGGHKGRRRMTVRGNSKIPVEHKNLKECRYVFKKREITFVAVASFSACVEPLLDCKGQRIYFYQQCG